MTTFSVVTACKSADERLRRTAASLRAQTALADGRARLDHRVVCADVSGASAAILSELEAGGAHILNEPDRGLYDGLAKGFAGAEGEVVSYLNAGDLYFPEAFGVLCEVFRLPEVRWVTGYSTLANEAGEKVAAWKPARFEQALFAVGVYCRDVPMSPWVQQESTFWSLEMMAGIDWDTFRGFRLAGDYYLWIEFSRLAPLASVHALLGAFLVNPGQLSSDRTGYRKEIAPHLERLPGMTRWRLRLGKVGPGIWRRFVARLSPAGGPVIQYNVGTVRWEIS